MKLNAAVGLIALIVLSACNKDDSSCPENIYLGEFTPTEKALASIPYRENTTVVFSDSLDNTLELSVSGPEYRMAHWRIPGHCPTNYYQEVGFEYDGGVWAVLLENDTSEVRLEIELYSLQEFTNHKVYDELVISVAVVGIASHQTINLPVDQRSLRNSEYEKLNKHLIVEESMTFFGRTFKDVHHEKYKADEFMFKTHYNLEQGVVAFRDSFGKKWVFLEVLEN